MPAFGAGLALALTLCACGSGSGSGDGSLGAGAPALRATAPPLVRGRTRRTFAVPVGVKQHVGAGTTTLSVTVTEVIDPLRDSGAALAPGTRAVGVAVRILNDGPGDYDSSSTGDLSIRPSAGVASPAYAPQGVCQTGLRDFDNEIGPGESRSGCVTFELDSQAHVVTVGFLPHAQAEGRAMWRVLR
jgi:hypothetical protein